MRNVAGLFVQKHEQTLRTLLVFKEGFWFFPGGKHEGDETLYETLVRELREELDMRLLCIPALVHTGIFSAIGGVQYRFHTFVCKGEHLEGVPTLNPVDSVKDFAWVDKPWELNLTTHARFVVEHFGNHAVGGI